VGKAIRLCFQSAIPALSIHVLFAGFAVKTITDNLTERDHVSTPIFGLGARRHFRARFVASLAENHLFLEHWKGFRSVP
jgi:hypothetical protein